MKTRILSGLIMLPLLVVVFLGDWILLAGCFVIAIMGVREFYSGFEKGLGIKPCRAVGYLSAISLYALGVFERLGLADTTWYLCWAFGVVFLSLLYLFKVDERKLEDGMATIIGAVYVVFFSYHVILIDLTDANILVWLVILSAFGTDVMAYFTGMAFGKHKLCPKISPKKTVEGAIGGFAGSVILCTAFGAVFAQDLILHCLIIGAIGGVISQLGDLSASIFKRKMGIKDYGNLIPGHGGILDRFDSVLFTAPMIYYYIAIVLQ